MIYVKMVRQFLIYAILILQGKYRVFGWERDFSCPTTCSCQLQHLTETAIYRFMQKDKSNPNLANTVGSIENNEVTYDETLDTIELLEEAHRSIIVRSATCILQTDTNSQELLDLLPENTEALTIIQGFQSGNKTVKFSWLTKFSRLRSLELVGPSLFQKNATNHLLCQIDSSLPELNYLNLERVLVHNSKEQIQSFIELKTQSENITFEYVTKMDGRMHPLTIVQQSNSNSEILPYDVFKEQRRNKGEIPLLVGFKKLLLLRITNCELNSIHWEMFDGLTELQYLILERNNLKYIPPFAFYGTPNLKTLSLAHNNLLDIGVTDLAGLLQLQYLDLTHNNFTQLSELSVPPFPKLKLANFANNPITMIFPNTFEVLNTTESLIIGNDKIPLALFTNSFKGMNLLKTLTVNNVKVDILRREFFFGMPQLKKLVLTGNISKIEFDAFLEITNLDNLILSHCKIYNISMDAFFGLKKLRYLDLSHNNLEYIPTGVFDELDNIREIYLNANKFQTLPRDVFSKIHARLIRLNENPWHCSCEMSEWKPIIVNRIKQKYLKACDLDKTFDKGVGCALLENKHEYKYVFDIKISPKCAQPVQFQNWSVFHAMRRILKCPEYKPKLKKHSISSNTIKVNNINQTVPTVNNIVTTTTTKPFKVNKVKKLKLKRKMNKNYLKHKLSKHLSENKLKLETENESNQNQNDLNNDLNALNLNIDKNNNIMYDYSSQISSNELNSISGAKNNM